MIQVYLASPYTHADPNVKRRRFELASKAAARMMQDGVLVFSPIAMTHPMAVYGNLHGTWEFWAAFDTVYVSLCEELHVLMLNGWEHSVGVKAEIDLALRLGKRVVYVEPCSLGVENE